MSQAVRRNSTMTATLPRINHTAKRLFSVLAIVSAASAATLPSASSSGVGHAYALFREAAAKQRRRWYPVGACQRPNRKRERGEKSKAGSDQQCAGINTGYERYR